MTPTPQGRCRPGNRRKAIRCSWKLCPTAAKLEVRPTGDQVCPWHLGTVVNRALTRGGYPSVDVVLCQNPEEA